MALVAQASACAILIFFHRNIAQAEACATKSHPCSFLAPLERLKTISVIAGENSRRTLKRSWIPAPIR